MTTTKLIKLSPMLIMVAFLAYAGYSIDASAGDPTRARPAWPRNSTACVQEIIAVGDAVADSTSGASPRPVPGRAQASGRRLRREDDESADPAVDTLAEIVQGLRLDATFLQGRDQMAIIDGRIYSKGQHLLIDGDSGQVFRDS